MSFFRQFPNLRRTSRLSFTIAALVITSSSIVGLPLTPSQHANAKPTAFTDSSRHLESKTLYPDPSKPRSTYQNSVNGETRSGDTEDPWLESLCLGAHNKNCDPDPREQQTGKKTGQATGKVHGKSSGLQDRKSRKTPRAWVRPLKDEPQSEIESIWASHAAQYLAYSKQHHPRGSPQPRKQARYKPADEARYSPSPSPPTPSRSRPLPGPLLSPLLSPRSVPGPRCEGQCCSNAAPALAPGVPKMTSTWISSQLADGARITSTWISSQLADGARVSEGSLGGKVGGLYTWARVWVGGYGCRFGGRGYDAKMTSTWISSQLADGARVVIRSKRRWGTFWKAANGAKWEGHVAFKPSNFPSLAPSASLLQVVIRSKRWGTFWTAPNGAKWDGRIAARATATPEPSQALTVIRVSNTEIKFMTPSNTYLAKAPGAFGYLRTTRNASNPRAVFTIKYIPGTVYVAFRSSDGYFVTQDGKNSNPQFKWKRAGEWERYDVREVMEVPAIRGANLGSWLMTEPWMNQGVFRFAGYSDGTQFTLRSVVTGKYVTAPGGGGTIGAASNFELFIFNTPLNASTEQSGSSVRVVLRALNGLFLQARSDGSLTADLQQSLENNAIWTSAAAFDLTVLWRVEADFQAAYTAGAAAPSIYENIRRNFITEADWQKLQELGINTVRIPLPYWIALDATPEFPFVPGAAAYLDWAFEMGAKYGVRIWFSVHVAPGSQAGRGNARDGLVRWQGENINRTLDFVTWLADRYGTDPMWLGMGLLNEPVVGGANGYAGVDLEDMRGYYSAAFNTIRARCLCCFVAMEGRVGSNFGDVMWHMNDAWHNNVLLEQHIYDVFGNFFSSKGVDWEIEYAHTTRKDNIIAFQQKVGRNLLVGEFCNAMGNSATPEQQANFSLGQMKAFSYAKAGWFFWSWKLNTTVPSQVGFTMHSVSCLSPFPPVFVLLIPPVAGTHHWQFVNSYDNGWLPKKPDGNWY
ncbi:unnamed protein product [Closterium sp. Yama58-4]|nr:unnamed protein product [Closterium sp. Yama58-4]